MNRTRSVSIGRHIVDLVVLGTTVLGVWFLWPAFLGGSSRMITVQGHSMEPTYTTGDLVVLDASVEPEVGRVVVFQIPANEPGGGQLVVHRIIGIRPDGTFITQGDNTAAPDAFLTARSDILGSPRFVIPRGGAAIGFASTPLGLAGGAGALCTMLMWPRKKAEEAADAVVPAFDEDGWTSARFSQYQIEEAELWLQTEVPHLV